MMNVEKTIETTIGKLNAQWEATTDPEIVEGISTSRRAMLHEQKRVLAALVRDIGRDANKITKPAQLLELRKQQLNSTRTAKGVIEEQHAATLAALARRDRGASVQNLGELEASL